jgi:hypothetical protein
VYAWAVDHLSSRSISHGKCGAEIGVNQEVWRNGHDGHRVEYRGRMGLLAGGVP